MKNIKNFIFDLGGVLLNVDAKLTEIAFINECKDSSKKFLENDNLRDFFNLFQLGKISPYELWCNSSKLLNVNISFENFLNCLNAMIYGYDKDFNYILSNLANSYDLYILSNTNETHVDYFSNLTQWPNNIFKHKFYSNEIHLAKPDINCFNYVINKTKIIPEETIFIDDRIENILSAQKVGLNTIHLDNQNMLKQILNNYIK